MSLPVHLDLVKGELTIAAHQVTCRAAGPQGEVRLGGDAGTLLRPLTFAERTAIVGRAVAEDSPLEAVASGILLTSVIENLSALGPLVLEIAALVLAGADQEAPAFEEASRIAQLRTGLDSEDIEHLPARDVDRLAHLEDDADPAHGWNRIVFTQQREWTLEEIRNELAGRILDRALEVTPATEPSLKDAPSKTPAKSVRRSVAEHSPSDPILSSHYRSYGSTIHDSPISEISKWGSAESPTGSVSWSESQSTEPLAFEKTFLAGETPDFISSGPSAHPIPSGYDSASPVQGIPLYVSHALTETTHELSEFSGAVKNAGDRDYSNSAWHREGQRDSLQTRVRWNVFSSSGVDHRTLPAVQQPTVAEDIADALALLLNEEADLRGID